MLKDIIKIVKKCLSPVVYEGRIKVEYVDYKSLVNLFISLFTYILISRMLKELHIPVDERGVEIDKLSGFIELYEKLDMPTNSLFLKNELYKIAGKTIYSDPKRNFFAHAGLSEGLIQIQPHEDKYYVKYIPERKSEIRSWLKYPTI